MNFEFLIKYRLSIVILILPLLCFIFRRFFLPNNLKELNEKSFYSISNKFISRNDLVIKELKINDYNNSRIYLKTNYNKISLFVILLKENYYEEKRIEFSICLNINNLSNISYDKNSFDYSENFGDKNIKFHIINENIFNLKKNYKLKFVSTKLRNNFTDLEIECFFEDFDLIMHLKKEKFTYKFFYLLESFITLIFNFLLSGIILSNEEYNLQNISIIFLLIIRKKLILQFIYRNLDFFHIGTPILKIFTFYFYLFLYGELIFSLTDIMNILALIIFFVVVCMYINIFKNNEINYFYCFNNKIEGNIIIKKNDNNNLVKNFNIQSCLILFIMIIFEYQNKIYLNSIPLLIALIEAILKHLLQREIMCKEDKIFCISFYFQGTIIYSFYLLMKNFGKFYRIKSSYSIFPFIIIFVLFFILNYIIKNDYKITYTMKDDFKKLKSINKDCCSICLQDFTYEDKIENKIFCKANKLYNINKTRCNHYFHEICLYSWRKYQNICPICKKDLDIPKYYYFYDYNPCPYKWGN